MDKVQADGVLGVGPGDDPDFQSVLTNLKDQKVIDKQIFSFYYSQDENNASNPSQFTLGGYDEERYNFIKIYSYFKLE